MTTTNPAPLTVKGTVELLSVIPYLLGFHPHESLVLAGVHSSRLVVTARLDLSDAHPPLLTHTLTALQRGGASSVTGVIVTEDPETHSEVGHWLAGAAAEAGLDVDDVVLATGGRWRSLCCTDPACCPPAGRLLPDAPTAVDAAAVHAGLSALPDRAALAAHFTPAADRPDLTDELAHYRERLAYADADGTSAGWDRSVVRALYSAQRTAKAGRMPTDDTLAWFGVTLRSQPIRDAVWRAVDAGQLDGLDLWVNLARRLPHPYDAGPLFLAGWHAYRAGNGTLASIAAGLALRADPDYQAAELLRAVLACGIGPHRLPALDPRMANNATT